MIILIFGANGWIGSQFLSILEKEADIQIIKSKNRAEDHGEIEKEIVKIRPTHVISFIGRTHGVIGKKKFSTIDYLEQEGKLTENIRDNLYAPLELALLCNKYDIHYTYLGTGCIFEYDSNHTMQRGFKEEENPNFYGSSYSIVKGFTDRIMKSFTSNVLNIRIRMPINDENSPRNFITKITNYERICSIHNSMTVLPELLPKLLLLMKNRVSGTINFTNPGTISHNEILQLYKDIVDPTFTWKNFNIDDQNEILASKRSNNYLDTSLLQHYFPNVLPIREAVKKCLERYPKPKFNIDNENHVKLLITGGCGFIGSHFLNYIYRALDKIFIINLDCLNYCSDIKNINEEIRSDLARYKFYHVDLKDQTRIQDIIFNEKPSFIIHFAAQSHVDNSFKDSLMFTQDNIIGTHHLLESCRSIREQLKLFIHVSTDEVYGESMLNEDMKDEQSVLCPTNPYAATKASAELLAKSYYYTYKLPIIISRGNNVYGPNQYPEKLIPKFIHLLKNNQKVTIQGDGSHLRAFLHVDDVARAFEVILLKGKVGEIYNIGCDPNMEYSVMEVAKKLIQKMKPDCKNISEWIEYIPDRLFNDKRYYISNERLKKLGWNITIPFEKGISDLCTF